MAHYKLGVLLEKVVGYDGKHRYLIRNAGGDDILVEKMISFGSIEEIAFYNGEDDGFKLPVGMLFTIMADMYGKDRLLKIFNEVEPFELARSRTLFTSFTVISGRNE